MTLSSAGGLISYVVLPVLVYRLTGSPGQAALQLTIQSGPYRAVGQDLFNSRLSTDPQRWVLTAASRWLGCLL